MLFSFLNLENKNGKKHRATPEEIERAFNKVDAINNSKENYAADSFEPKIHSIAIKHKLDNIFLEEDAIDTLLIEHLRSSAKSLRRKFPKFDNYIISRQQWLLDMEYNLGPTKFVENRIVDGVQKGWPKFFKAVDEERWDDAAAESHRQDISDQRNENTYNGFKIID